MNFDLYHVTTAVRSACGIELGAFPRNRVRNRGVFHGSNGTEISWGKVPENPEILEFPHSEPFKRKFRKSREEIQMERKFPEKSFRELVLHIFKTLCKFAIFYSALAVLAAIRASSTPHAKMTGTSIRKWIDI